MSIEFTTIQYLLEEIEKEMIYNTNYNETVCRHGYAYAYENLPRSPRKSIIQENSKLIRRLLLKLSKECDS